MTDAEKALLGISPGSNILEQFIVKELIKNLLKVLGVSVEAIGEKTEGNEGGTDGGNEGGKKAKTTVGETGKKNKNQKTKEGEEQRIAEKLKPFKTMSRQDWKNKREGWVRTRIDPLSIEAILTLMNNLGLRPDELTGHGAGGWKGRTSSKKAQVVDACVACIMK